MRAPKLCSEPGCTGDAAQKSGRCEEHAEAAWVRSTRTTSKAWSTQRRRTLQRDRRRCLFCGRAATVVDHRRPLAWGGTDDLDNLQTMCPEDHKVKTAEEARLGRMLAGGARGQDDVDRHVMRWTPDLSIFGITPGE